MIIRTEKLKLWSKRINLLSRLMAKIKKNCSLMMNLKNNSLLHQLLKIFNQPLNNNNIFRDKEIKILVT